MVIVDHCMDSEVRMLHRRVPSAALPRLLLTVIGLSLLGIACQNPLQSPPTFQDKFNQIRLESNETSGMTLTEVREILDGRGRNIPYTEAEKLELIRTSRGLFNSVNILRLSRHQWVRRQGRIIVARITVVFFDGNAIFKIFSTSR